MAKNVVDYLIKISTAGQTSVEKATSAVTNLNQKVNQSTGMFSKLAKIASGLFAAYKVGSYVQQATTAFTEESVAVAKLSKVMQNTMNATQAETQSILDLAAAQQKLGVISAGVQVAGAQELATYLSKGDSLKKLMPVMNDIVAQQYGLNATQEQAVNIATMVGKVMDGQVGALSRYGYTFSEAQEKILKFGTEEQRAATLADVVSASVGNMNAALANTPKGRLKQVADNLGDIQTKIGKAALTIRSAFVPAIEYVGNILGKLAGWFEQSQMQIISVTQSAAAIFIRSLQIVGETVKKVAGIYNWFIDGVRAGNPVFIGAAATISMITGTLIAYKTIMGIVTVFTKLWTTAQIGLNTALLVNPIGLIIAGIVALIALVSYVIYKTDGWGKTWENAIQFMSKLWETFKANLHLKWMQIQDFFMTGIEVIQVGWYKLQSLWDKDSANAGLQKLTNQRNERAQEIAAAKGKVDELSQQLADMKVWEVTWNKERSLLDLTNGLKKQLGIGQTETIAASGLGIGGAGGGSDVPSDIKKGNEAIATGGTRSTNINIDIGKMLETVNIYAQDFNDGMKDLEDKVIEAVTRALVTAQSLAR